MVSIGTIIKFERRRLKMTQLQLAKSTGLSQTYISQIERDDRNCTIEVIHALAKGLDIPSATLLMMAMEKREILAFFDYSRKILHNNILYMQGAKKE